MQRTTFGAKEYKTRNTKEKKFPHSLVAATENDVVPSLHTRHYVRITSCKRTLMCGVTSSTPRFCNCTMILCDAFLMMPFSTGQHSEFPDVRLAFSLF